MVRCPADVGTLFLCRKLPAKAPPPPIVIQSPKIYTTKQEMQVGGARGGRGFRVCV